MEVSVRVFFPEPPAYAELAPTRAVYVGDAAGRCEVFTWDATRRTRRQLTDRPQGTINCAVDPTGEHVWWFDDDLTGIGVWQVQPFSGPGTARPSGFPAGRAAGLAMAMDGTVAAGIGDDSGMSVYLARPDAPVQPLTRVNGYAQLVDLAGSGALAVLAGEPDAPDAVTVLDTATGERMTLSGEPNALWATGFATGSDRLLLTIRSADGYRLAIWTVEAGLTVLDWCVFDTEISPTWYPDGHRILIRQDRHARSTLHEVDPERRTRALLDTPRGSLLAAAVQPDGDLQYVWTDSTRSPRLRSTSGLRLANIAEDDAQPGRLDEIWVDTPAGPVHTLLTLPDSPGPHPAVFLLHGGPFDAARDAYDPLVSVFVSIGCAVVRPNYRGSTGYGAAWRAGFDAGVGLTQLHDLAAVRAHLVDAGLVSPDRTAVCGQSWGGYLALLAAGVQPDLWHAVAAVNPIADYPAAFRETTPAIRALDVALFGGTPDDRAAEYARSSPATYVSAVRAPVLVVAGSDDPKCPPGQIRGYVAALRRHGRKPVLEWTNSGHEGYEIDAHVQVLGAVVRFVGTAMGGKQAPATAGAS
jgi:dipeptidyl aminopeptidase/acylaminoacyl peptidase